MSDWPYYVSHKVVRARDIVDIRIGSEVELYVEAPEGNGIIERFIPNEPGMAGRAKLMDKAVIYDDGYKSVSPREAFVTGYTRLT